jgi:hypothetical protein
MPLPFLPLNPNLQCKQIKKNGERCKNPKAYGTAVCRYHGATPPASRKKSFGKNNGNYRVGDFTQEKMLERQRWGSNFDALKKIGVSIGMFDGVGRGRPFTLHPDTEANQILMMWNKQQRQKQKIQEHLKESSQGKTIEEIEQRIIEILNEVEGDK